MQPSQPNQLDIDNIDREICSRSLVDYTRYMWPVVEPSREFVDGWHIGAVSEHLEAVTAGQITRLLINVPPGTMKSLSVNVFWPTWEWGPKNMPHLRTVAASHREGLALRDNLRARRIIESSLFQRLWDVKLCSDQNAKLKFENTTTGFREAMAISSMTGARGDRIAIDDPHTVDGSDSVQKRESTCETFFESVSNRLNDPDKSAIVVVMQRLHERDLSGQILERELGYEHLMLPMEFEPARRCTTSIGFSDPRTKEGELLFPSRFPKGVVERDKRTLGSYASAGQLQQRPAPRKGGMFDGDMFEVIDYLSAERVKTVRYWDKAGTDDGGAYTAGVKMSLLADGSYVVEHVERGQWSAAKREAVIKLHAEKDAVTGKVTIWMEQEPGSAGKDVAHMSIKALSGHQAFADIVSGKGSKETRALPYSAQVEIGNVKLLRGSWNTAFIDEHRMFPRGTYKDQVDAASGAFNKLTKGKERPKFQLPDVGKQINPHSLDMGVG